MSDRYHTLILVPHTRAKLRKWRVSSVHLKLAGAALIAAMIAASIGIWYSLERTSASGALDRLESENAELRRTNEAFETSIRRLEQQLSAYEDRTRKLSIATGIESHSGAGGGIGGDTAAGYETYESYLGSMEVRAGRIQDQLDRVENEVEARTARIAATPTVAPVRGILTCGFGYRRDPFTGRPAFHPAIDISAPMGQPVSAPADGIVLATGAQGGLGKSISVSHGFGLATRYGHLSGIAVRPGQLIKRGETIGYVGNTGRSTGVHLHYEVHVDGAPVDPLNYILADDLAR